MHINLSLLLLGALLSTSFTFSVIKQHSGKPVDIPLTAFWHDFVSKNICVSLSNGVLPCRCLFPSECAVKCLAYMPNSVCATRKGEKRDLSKLLLCYQVVLCYCVEVKQGRYSPAAVRETEERDWRARTECQASYWSWNFKNFWEEWSKQWDKQFDEFFEDIQEDLWIFQRVPLQKYMRMSFVTVVLCLCWLSVVFLTVFEF